MAPRKRARAADGTFVTSGGSVTGGTGDIKPQIMTVSTPGATGTNDYTVLKVDTPRNIMPVFGATTVMEILRVDWYLAITALADNDVVNVGYLSFRPVRAQNDATTLASFSADVAEASVFAFALVSEVETTTGALSTVMPISIDMTDNNGNGFLVATQAFFVTTGQFSNSISTHGTCKILYRISGITLQEYIGIVQTQTVG